MLALLRRGGAYNCASSPCFRAAPVPHNHYRLTGGNWEIEQNIVTLPTQRHGMDSRHIVATLCPAGCDHPLDDMRLRPGTGQGEDTGHLAGCHLRVFHGHLAGSPGLVDRRAGAALCRGLRAGDLCLRPGRASGSGLLQLAAQERGVAHHAGAAGCTAGHGVHHSHARDVSCEAHRRHRHHVRRHDQHACPGCRAADAGPAAPAHERRRPGLRPHLPAGRGGCDTGHTVHAQDRGAQERHRDQRPGAARPDLYRRLSC